ncbi:MAG: FAD:protein FMN transferase [Pirellulales bacterium]|nr:FAD:protein FMN transferase [Pirellulales bacterium]
MAVELVGGVLWGEPPESPPLRRYEFTQTEMAVTVHIILYAAEDTTARQAAHAALNRFHQLNAVLSDYDAGSELRRLCRTSSEGKAVPVSNDLWQVLLRAQELSARSEGAFDVTVGAATRLWRKSRQLKELPSPQALQSVLSRVNYRWIRLHPKDRSVELLRPDLRLDVGGIAKGYANDAALEVLRQHHVTRALIEAGGDLRLGDPPPGKAGWRIGVGQTDPKTPPRFYLELKNVALATSGDMWQFVEIAGKRYSHVLDPRTGLGLTDRRQVTVVAPDGTTADGLSTAACVLGHRRGLALIEDTPGAAAYFLRAAGNNEKIEEFSSRRWKDFSVIKE